MKHVCSLYIIGFFQKSWLMGSCLPSRIHGPLTKIGTGPKIPSKLHYSQMHWMSTNRIYKADPTGHFNRYRWIVQSINSVIVVWHSKVIGLVSLNQQKWTHKTHKYYIFGVSKARSAATNRFLSSTSGASFQKPNRSPTLRSNMHANFGILSLDIQTPTWWGSAWMKPQISPEARLLGGSFHTDPHQVFAGLWMSKVRATWCSV